VKYVRECGDGLSGRGEGISSLGWRGIVVGFGAAVTLSARICGHFDRSRKVGSCNVSGCCLKLTRVLRCLVVGEVRSFYVTLEAEVYIHF
jgi:hypothetical protein